MPDLHNARLADGQIVDLVVDDDGTIAQVRAATDRPASAVASVDLGGWLTVAAFAEPHAHLDKALTAELVPNPSGDLMGAITAWNEADAAGRLTVADTTERAVVALEQLVVNGVTSVRSHVNVGARGGVESVHAVRAAADRMSDLIDVELVALLHPPLAGPDADASRAALDAAVEAGVDVVGGCPHLEPDAEPMIEHVLTVAARAGLPVDLHVDETLDASMLTLPMIARAVRASGFDLGVTASHCVSLGMQSASEQASIAALVAEAGLSVVALPQTNLFLQGRDHATATPRGLTAIAALRAAGVNVAAGADNVQDPFNLMGRSDPLETAALLVMAAHVSPDEALDMVTSAPRVAMGAAAVGPVVGARADLVAIDAVSPRAAIAEAPMARRTIRGGRLVASSSAQSSLHRG